MVSVVYNDWLFTFKLSHSRQMTDVRLAHFKCVQPIIVYRVVYLGDGRDDAGQVGHFDAAFLVLL